MIFSRELSTIVKPLLVRIASTALCGLTLLTVSSESATGCTCITPTLETAFREAAWVAYGIVRSVAPDTFRLVLNDGQVYKRPAGRIYTFEIIDLVKGHVSAPVFVRLGTTCDRWFDTLGGTSVLMSRTPYVPGDTISQTICSVPCCIDDRDLAKKLDYLTGRGQFALGVSAGASSSGGTGMIQSSAEVAARLAVAPHVQLRGRLRHALGREASADSPPDVQLAVEGIFRWSPAFEAVSPYAVLGAAWETGRAPSSTSDADWGLSAAVGIDLPIWSDQYLNEYNIRWLSTVAIGVELRRTYLLHGGGVQPSTITAVVGAHVLL